ncbi:MAG: hypothetical protein V2I41_00535, partial [Pseudomonadales bacterium]|nr:hypothetical protein [Pseudomonadales bacterium]
MLLIVYVTPETTTANPYSALVTFTFGLKLPLAVIMGVLSAAMITASAISVDLPSRFIRSCLLSILMPFGWSTYFGEHSSALSLWLRGSDT